MPSPLRPNRHSPSSHLKKGVAVRDDRRLPLAEPYDKHAPHPPRHQRAPARWTWAEYQDWMVRCWSRRWRHKALKKVIALRQQEDANADVDWTAVPTLWDTPGWIYALYHFPSGRLYVGQTTRKVWLRTREHWWSRARSKDLLHEALANDQSPFAYIVLPLEKLPSPTSFPRAKRDELVRRDALARERKWVGKLNTMWPHGFNAAFPGVPVSRKVLRKTKYGPRPDDSVDTVPPPAPDLADWVKRCQGGDNSALQEAHQWGKARLCAALDWLQENIPTDERRIGHLSLEVKLIELVRKQRKEAPERHFLKFMYTNNDARYLNLRQVLRNVEVYKKHPNPEVAAAIMVCDKFAPQWQAWLCNYAKAAEELDIEAARFDPLTNCSCTKALRTQEAEALQGGHVVSNDSDLLRWPYLRSIATKGKKFRLEGPPDAVLQELRKGLDQYTDWAGRSQPHDMTFQRKLKEWADAVEAQCYTNWQRRRKEAADLLPTGYPGLVEQIREAQKDLVFLHDDRAPHGLMFVCKRWYQNQMATYLADTTVFEEVPEPYEEVIQRLATFNQKWHFPTGSGVVYNYGIWKPLKKKFRFIAGTRKGEAAKQQEKEVKDDKPKEPPRQPLYHLNKTLVGLLKSIEEALKEKDERRQQEEGVKAFWGIDSVEAFVRMVRSSAPDYLRGGLETVDFTTMYTSFSFDSIISRTLESAREAWEFVRNTKAPLGMDDPQPRVTQSGWAWNDLGYSMVELKELVTFAVENNFTYNGGRVRRQIRGMPMGLPPAPQLANLGCYPIERDHMYRLPKELRSTAVARYIDDILKPSTMPLPTADDYGMEYKTTGLGESVVYLGVKVYIKETNGQRELHTIVHDREEEYPHHIVRYPLGCTTAPTEQLGGVVMGRLVFAQMACSHMDDFKRSVANVFRNAMWRSYSRHLVQSVWSRFLFQRWHASDVRVKELRAWFPRIWRWLHSGEHRAPPPPYGTATPVDVEHNAKGFYDVFGRRPPPPLDYPQPREPLDDLLQEITEDEQDDVMEVDRAAHIRHGKQRAPGPQHRYSSQPPPSHRPSTGPGDAPGSTQEKEAFSVPARRPGFPGGDAPYTPAFQEATPLPARRPGPLVVAVPCSQEKEATPLHAQRPGPPEFQEATPLPARRPGSPELQEADRKSVV